MEQLDFALIGFAFLSGILFTYATIKRLNFLGIISSDLHKEERPKKPKIGGIGIAAAFAITIIAAYFVKNSFPFVVILLSFLTIATIGLIDDLLQFEPWRKLILASFGAIPLLLIIPLHPLTILFLFGAVTIASNWTNMLAGFNGLESGTGAIMLFFLALSTNVQNTQLVLLIYAAALLGFVFFNKYPAQIFPGDVGTLPIGTILVAATFLGAPFYKLAILFIPHIIDAVLKFGSLGVFSSTQTKPTEIKSGFLIAPKSGSKTYLSLSRAILSLRPMREWELVLTIWIIEIILGLITLII